MKKDLTGREFDNWKVIEVTERTRNGHLRWLCKCKCGKEKGVLSTHLLSGKSKSCGCSKRRSGSANWTGYGEISGSVWKAIQRSADGSKGRRTPLEFDLTIEFAWKLYEKQSKKCALSGVEIGFIDLKGRSASLDRIDNSKGYTKCNVQWLHKDINWMKGRFDQKYFIKLCKNITDNN